MKTLKKLFSVSAIVALLGTLAPMYAFGATYTAELEEAYAYAYKNGITTMTSIDNANMFGSLTRIAMAKMIANYATTVLGLEPDTSAKCSFTDVTAALDAQYDNGVTKACQLGLMGQNITAFRPNDPVTRAEFGTTLSRALNANSDDLASMNAANPYYKEHLNFLKNEGIMTQIDNPSMTEVRGYVMLMMMRADESYTPAEGCTAEELLKCVTADDYDACIAACTQEEEPEPDPDEIKAGILKVGGTDVSYDSIPNAGLISFGKIKLTATDEDITVRAITLKKSGGLGSLSTTTRVFLEKDGVRVTGRAKFDNGEALITLTTPLVVKSSEELDIILSLAEDPSEQFQFTTTDIDCSAEKVNGSYTTKTLTTVNYPIASLTGTTVGGTAEYKVDSDKLVEFGEVSFVRSGTKSVTVKSITLNNSGSSDLEYLKDAALYRDSVKVSTKAVIEGKTISFVLDDEIKTTDTSATNYVVKAKITDADRVGDTYQLYLKNKEDINIVETETSFRASVNLGATTNLMLITVKGSDLKFTETNISAIKVVPGDKKVKFYEGTIESSESITLGALSASSGVYMNSTVAFDQILDNLYVKIGNQIVAAETIPSTTTGAFVFDSEFVVDGKAVFEVYGDIKSNAPGATIQNNGTVSKANFATAQYANGQPVNSSMGSISSRKVTIASASVSLSNTSPASKNVQRGDKKVELGKLEYSTTSDITAKLYSFKAILGGVYGDFDGAQVSVYNGNTLLASEGIVTGTDTLSFSFDAIDIVKGTPVELSVILDKVPATVSGGNTLTIVFSGSVVKANNNNQATNPAFVSGTTLKVIAGGTAEFVDQALSKQLILQGEPETLGSLKIKAINGDVKLTSLTLSGGTDFAAKARNVKLMAGEEEIATFIKSGVNFIVEDLDEDIVLGNPSAYTIKATISNATTSGDLMGTFKLEAKATFESPFGADLGSLTGYVSDEITTVVSYPTIKSVEGIKGSNYASLKITFHSDKPVEITKDTLTGVIGGNLTGLDSITAWDLGSTVNGTQYNGKDITIDGDTIVYATATGLTRSSTTSGDPYINLGLTNFSINSVFDDGSKKAHADMLANFREVITELTDLGVNIK